MCYKETLNVRKHRGTQVAVDAVGRCQNECISGHRESVTAGELHIVGSTHKDHCGLVVLKAGFQSILHHPMEGAVVLLALVERMQL